MKRTALLIFTIACFASSAGAIPTLQLYIDGANYDPATETWITLDTTFDLWVIGNVNGPGAHGNSILDVALSAAVFANESGTITLTPKTTSTVTDPSLPSAPTYNGLSAAGDVPQLNDGSNLATHGIYGPLVRFHEWEIGDLTLTDSPVGDFITAYPPVAWFPGTGQINVYEVTVTGYSAVHFDTYNTVEGETHSSFAPFSHDAGGGGEVPEPGSILLMGLGISTVVAGARRRRQRR